MITKSVNSWICMDLTWKMMIELIFRFLYCKICSAAHQLRECQKDFGNVRLPAPAAAEATGSASKIFTVEEDIVF